MPATKAVAELSAAKLGMAISIDAVAAISVRRVGPPAANRAGDSFLLISRVMFGPEG
jgi:hypothetical protein